MRKIKESDRFDRILCRKIYHDDLYASLFDTTKFDAEKRRNIKITCQFHAHQLFKLECFVDELLSNEEPPFKLRSGNADSKDYDRTSLATTYFQLVPSFVEVVNVLSPMYEYSERINVFISCCGSMGLLTKRLDWKNIWLDQKKKDHRFGGDSAAEIFNILVNEIRSEWKAQGLQAKVNKRKTEANERYVDYCKYVDSLFAEHKGHARLIVLRIDLNYDKQFANNMSVFDIRDDLNQLLKNKRHNFSVLGSMKGYIAKLEYGVDKGFHWHTLFFFDGSERKGASHSYMAEAIGKYWNTVITKDRGAYWNVNNNADHYDRLARRGIGVINWDDAKLISNLKEFVVGYLCKMDQFIKPILDSNVKLESKVRLLRRGDFPKKRPNKQGRPRMNKKPPNQT